MLYAVVFKQFLFMAYIFGLLEFISLTDKAPYMVVFIWILFKYEVFNEKILTIYNVSSRQGISSSCFNLYCRISILMLCLGCHERLVILKVCLPFLFYFLG